MVADRSRTSTKVTASGVVRATTERVLALLFLDQRTTARGRRPSYDAWRALLTMVQTHRGWRAADVQTQ
jgi:Mce-associated membrane protein